MSGDADVPLVDVRPEIAAGGEPLEKILAAAEAVGAGGSFAVLAPFEPVPLVRLLARRGFTASTERLDSGDFRVLFRRAS